MSHTVLKDALQLMQDDLNPTADEPGQRKKGKTKNAMKLISTNRKGVWKELRRLQKQEQERMKRKRSKKTDLKSAIEKYQEEQHKRKMQQPESCSFEMNKNYRKNAQAVLDFHLKHINRRKQTVEAEKKEESTVFTDKDFDKFEEEYDFFK